MRRRLRNHQGNKSRDLKHRVPTGKGIPKRSRITGKRRKLVLQKVLKDWKNFDSEFIMNSEPGALVLKLKNLAFNETFTTILTVKRARLELILVYGFSKKFQRSRLLGYIIIYAPTPIIHAYTFFAGICYSDVTNIGSKEPVIIFDDPHTRLYRIGIGDPDYLFGYRHKKKEHDPEGCTDGAVHKEMSATWRDGF